MAMGSADAASELRGALKAGGQSLPYPLRVVRVAANGSSRLFAPLLFRLVDRATCRRVQIDGHLGGLEIIAEGVAEDSARAVLYLHGGGHFFGSVWTHREFLARASRAWRARVVAVDYRLAPEDPFPAGLEDTLAAWRWLRAQHPPGTELCVAGDSAGGNLAFALLVRLAQLGERQPSACIGLSPWLALDEDNTGLPLKPLGYLAGLYAQGQSLADPLISPVRAGLELVRQFPPILIHADADEPMSVDSQEMASLCKKAGVPVELKLYPGTLHGFQVWPLLFSKESRNSLEEIACFLDSASKP